MVRLNLGFTINSFGNICETYKEGDFVIEYRYDSGDLIDYVLSSERFNSKKRHPILFAMYSYRPKQYEIRFDGEEIEGLNKLIEIKGEGSFDDFKKELAKYIDCYMKYYGTK